MNRLNLSTKHYMHNLTRIELRILRVEVLKVEDGEVEDEVDVTKIILRMIVKSKLVDKIDVAEDNKKARRSVRSGVF